MVVRRVLYNGIRDTYMFQVWDWYVEEVLEFLGDAKILDYKLRLFAEMPVYDEGLFGVNVRHLKVMF